MSIESDIKYYQRVLDGYRQRIIDAEANLRGIKTEHDSLVRDNEAKSKVLEDRIQDLQHQLDTCRKSREKNKSSVPRSVVSELNRTLLKYQADRDELSRENVRHAAKTRNRENYQSDKIRQLRVKEADCVLMLDRLAVSQHALEAC